MLSIRETINPLWDRLALPADAVLLTNFLMAFAIMALGWMLSRWVGRVVNKRLSDGKGIEVSATVRPLIATLVRYIILLAALYAALDTVGIPASSLLAVIGAAGLAIALAVQGTLANVASGVMLIFLRIFRVGEYISGPNAEGTVLELGLFTTHIRRPDGVLSIVPNAQIWGARLDNFSRHANRRLDINLEIARDNDLGAALAALDAAIADHPRINDHETSSVIIASFGPQSAVLQVRCWLAGSSYRQDSSVLHKDLHDVLTAGGFKLPPILAVSPQKS